jgi:hypothetical protein
MKRIVRLTESDLTRLVKKIINENVFAKRRSEYILDTMYKKVKQLDRNDPRHDHLQLLPEFCDMGYEKMKKIFINGIISEMELVEDGEYAWEEESDWKNWYEAIDYVFDNIFEPKFKKFYEIRCRPFKDKYDGFINL